MEVVERESSEKESLRPRKQVRCEEEEEEDEDGQEGRSSDAAMWTKLGRRNSGGVAQ